MTRRCFAPSPIGDSKRVDLDDAESHHLRNVMRADEGDEVVLFDGTGMEFTARIASIGRRGVAVDVLSSAAVDREARRRVTLGISLPKGDRQKWLVEKCTEIGIQRIVPLVTERGVAQPTGGTIDRLRRAAIEASKQCGRNRLMEIGPAMPCDEFLTSAPSDDVRWIADPTGVDVAEFRDNQLGQDAAEIAIAVGPEGGFTNRELAIATEADWQVVRLGPRILRVETAAIAISALVIYGNPHVSH